MTDQTPIESPQQSQPPKSHWHFHLPWWAWVSVLIVAAFAVSYYAWVRSLEEPVENGYTCIQVITTARNKQTGEIRDFPTPCDVPAGWEKVEPDVMDETANWKTYRNDEYGFEVKYSHEFTATFINETKVLELGIDPGDREFAGIWMYIKDNQDALPLLEWWQQSREYDSEYLTENITIGGSHALKVYTPDNQIYLEYYFVEKDGQVFEFYTTIRDYDLVSQILSTFRFVERTSASGLLLTIVNSGGLCQYGLCRSERNITMEGSFTVQGELTGSLTSEELSSLKQLISQTDFDKVRSVPFTDICPAAYDGLQAKYTFYTSRGTEMVDSCETNIDESSDLFEMIDQIIQKYSRTD